MHVDAVCTLARALQSVVEAEAFDVLVYGDAGIDPTTTYLAHARLAPVRVCSRDTALIACTVACECVCVLVC